MNGLIRRLLGKSEQQAEAQKPTNPLRYTWDNVSPVARMGSHALDTSKPSWREPPLPGLELTAAEKEAKFQANQVAREIETPRRSIWADDMREAENTALRVAAVENTHDHSRGRDE